MFTFELKGINHTCNTTWFNITDFDFDEIIKISLHRGGRSSQNTYSADTFLLDNIGFTSYPLKYLTCCGEVGHWLGLLHTFGDDDGTCDSSPTAGGDFISNTSAEADAAYSCADIGWGTCPELPGLDVCTFYPFMCV